MKRLPRSLDEIGGLRAARWIRESTAGQYDRYGPASQREQQDRFIERHGLVDTGLVYQVAHSGRTVWRSATMASMVEDLRSGRFDLLLTGYSDRWQRNLRRTLELLEDELHPNGVALVMCDRKILSSDPSDWDELISEAAGAEKYSRRLSERITEGYAAKFDQERDPGGHAALGFRRLPEPPHTLEGGNPPRDAETEYSFYFERAYPRAEDRRRYLDQLIADAHPGFGHLGLAALMMLSKVGVIWTTNFDRLIEDAAAQVMKTARNLTTSTTGDSSISLQALRDERFPLLVKLHGDFQSEQLKNTTAELQSQDAQLREALRRSAARYGLAVLRYSDVSVAVTTWAPSWEIVARSWRPAVAVRSVAMSFRTPSGPPPRSTHRPSTVA